MFAVATTVILATIVMARYLPIRFMARKKPERMALFPVFGRGLDTAVLATLPFLAASYVQGSGYYKAFSPWEPVFVNLALLTIMLTVLVSSLAAFVYDRKQPPQPPARPATRGDETVVPLRAARPAPRPAKSAPPRK